MDERFRFRLPFEFDNDDKLGPWDILLSENAVKNLKQLGVSTTNKVLKKLGQLSTGAWIQHQLVNIIRSDTTLTYEVKLSEKDDPKIIWQIDSGFSTRQSLLMQNIKVWAITNNQEEIENVLENLEMAHQVYTAEHINRCAVEVSQDGVTLPKVFEGEEAMKSTESRLDVLQEDDERMLEVHKALVTNKFVPLSTVEYAYYYIL